MKKSGRLLVLVVFAVALGLGCSPADPVGLENGSFFAELNGFRIHYEVHGQGPVLMTVPNSWGLSLAGLRGLYRPLEEHLTMVYFDPRGMGESDPIRADADMGMAAVRADFDALRRHLGLATVSAIGWSNGAGNLVLLAAEYPTTITSAIFLHGLASFTAQDMAEFAELYPELVTQYGALQQELADESMTVADKNSRLKQGWIEGVLAFSCADRAAAPAMLGELFKDASFSFAHADYSRRESATFDATDKLSAITARSLIIAGAHDTIVLDKAYELEAGIADAKLSILLTCGHFAPVEAPEQFKTTVLEFLIPSA